MLEQYGFIKNLFDFSSDKVRASALFSIIINLIITAVGYFNYFANEILGMSASAAIMIFVIMAVDYITGIRASKADGIKPCSKKGLRGIFKLCSYTVFIYVLNGLVKEAASYDFTWLTYPMNAIKLLVMFMICFWETKSIDENFERMGYSFRIFKLLDPIYEAVKGIFKKNNIDIGGDEDE